MSPSIRTRAARLLALPALLAAASLLTAGCSGDPLHLMPEAASHEAHQVDELTYLIVWLTIGTFVLVQAVLLWFLWAYRAKPGVRASHTHGNHAVEMVWTITPAAILVFLAVYQMGLWSKMKSTEVPQGIEGRKVPVQIMARQFEWYFRYPGADGQFATADDLVRQGDLVVPVNAVCHAELRSLDVIHSFFLPHFRFKQDAVPGLQTKLWFRPVKLSADREPVKDRLGRLVKLDYWDIVCAELCGNSHTYMAARLYVVSDADFDRYAKGEAIQVDDQKGGKRAIQLAKWDAGAKRGEGAFWTAWSHQDDQTVKGPPKNPKHPFAAKAGEEE